MNKVEQEAIQTYEKNISFLKKSHPNIYNKIATLESAISSGAYKENFALEYKDEGYFDIVELSSGLHYYDQNSINYSKTIVDSANTSRNQGIFRGQRFVDFSPEMADIIDKSELSFHNALWATAKIVEYSKKYAPKETTYMKCVNKLIFLGTGLGLHIPPICKKLNSSILFIKEDNIEIFRLSFFTTDYTKFSSNNKLFFSIMENEQDLKNSFLSFMNAGYNHNLYLKYFPMTGEYEDQTLQLHDFLMGHDYVQFPYSAYLLSYIEGYRYIAKKYSILDVSNKLKQTPLSNKPILLLLSGPSTKNNIDWLKNNAKYFTIISALSTCKLLHSYNISPDVVAHIDPNEEGTLSLFKDIDMNYFNDILFLFSSNVPQKIVSNFKKEKCYIIQQGISYKKDFGNFSSSSVGEYIYGISLILGAKKIYLLGMDLAFDPDTLMSHAKGFHHGARKIQRDADFSKHFEQTAIEIKGNFLPFVPSNLVFKSSIEQFERFSKILLSSDEEVYNLSNGAYLEGAKPLKASEVNIEKSLDKPDLKDFFDSISNNVFRPEDKNMLKCELREVKRLKRIVKEHKKKIFSNSNTFLESLYEITGKLSSKKESSSLNHVFDLYFKVILSYIQDIFNTKDFNPNSDNIKGINEILVKQLEKICNTYLEAMEEYIR